MEKQNYENKSVINYKRDHTKVYPLALEIFLDDILTICLQTISAMEW